MVLLVLLLTLTVGVSPASAKYLGATGVEVTSQYVHADSALCSCSLSDGYYRHYNITFLNRCPNCGGKLAYECRSYWVEGLWYCTRCDMDFCVVHGKSHDGRGMYLKRYVIPPPAPEPVEDKKSETVTVNIEGRLIDLPIHAVKKIEEGWF